MLTPKCICGHKIYIKRGQKTRRCPDCGVPWLRDKSGYWAMGLNTVLFTPKEKFLIRREVTR